MFKDQEPKGILTQNLGMTVKQKKKKKIKDVLNKKDKITSKEGTQQQRQD